MNFTPQMAQTAKRFELQARQHLQQDHTITAGEAFFAASVMYGGAQWPILSQTESNKALEKKKTACYLEYIKFADHSIEPIEVPYNGRPLAGYLHLPPGYMGERLHCIVMVTGMDAFKEQSLFCVGDRYLRRGFAVLCLDVPGQGTSLPRGIWYDPDKFDDVGVAAFEAMAGRKEFDLKRIMVWA